MIAPALVMCTAITVTIGASRTLHVTFTQSLPRGIYHTVAGPPSRGATVIACLPAAIGQFARSRGYLWRGDCPGGAAPVGKVVAAVTGDTVVASADGLIVNGHWVKNTQVLTCDTSGRPLRHFPYGIYVLAPGELWLASSHNPWSFDSRYFGPVGTGAVHSRIAPLWPRTQRNWSAGMDDDLSVKKAAAGSLGQCNALGEYSTGCLKAKRLAGSGIQLQRDRIEIRLGVRRQVSARREVLA